ncbi:unnamed protein product, partial [Closterium sp. NIES-54]
MADTQRHLERWLAAHSYNHTCLQSFNCSSLRSHVLPLLLVIVFLSSLSPSLEAEAAGPVRQVVKLGFLLPYPKADHVIPLRLADEWIAASRVALEVLGPKYSDAFDVVPHIANSNCDRQEAKEAAQLLLRDGVVGVVGPACTEAALGAADVLVPAGVPIVSFAATWDGFRDRERFGSFFRTV